jgi:hypothetical protein
MDAVLDAWRWPFLAIKNAPVVEASVWMRKGRQPLHATWVLSLTSRATDQRQLLEFLKRAAVALRADFACLHVLTPAELERGRARKVVLALNKQATRFTFSVGNKDLQKRIPDLFWVTVLGAPYLRMFVTVRRRRGGGDSSRRAQVARTSRDLLSSKSVSFSRWDWEAGFWERRFPSNP